MEPLAPAGPLAVAVSGGADSMALLCLAARWGKRPLTALTVDHGLRAESAEEARRVKGWAEAQGVPHVTLAWRGEKPKANLQAAARAARYGLLAQWCRDARVEGLLLAHTLDDQAETVLLRLARGSGVNGLAAMAPATRLRGVTLLRPLLGISRARIVATLEALRQPWIEDPSNEDTRFARVRLRKARARARRCRAHRRAACRHGKAHGARAGGARSAHGGVAGKLRALGQRRILHARCANARGGA